MNDAKLPKNLKGWKSERDFKKYRRTLGIQIQDIGKSYDGSRTRAAIAKFKKDPAEFIRQHETLGKYIALYG